MMCRLESFSWHWGINPTNCDLRREMGNLTWWTFSWSSRGLSSSSNCNAFQREIKLRNHQKRRTNRIIWPRRSMKVVVILEEAQFSSRGRSPSRGSGTTTCTCGGWPTASTWRCYTPSTPSRGSAARTLALVDLWSYSLLTISIIYCGLPICIICRLITK